MKNGMKKLPLGQNAHLLKIYKYSNLCLKKKKTLEKRFFINLPSRISDSRLELPLY